MKKVYTDFKLTVVAACMLVMLAAAGGLSLRAQAAASPTDNYGAYIVATGSISGGDGMTSYYTQIGDGNAVLQFDLLSANSAGWFGIICGDSKKLGTLADMKDYALFGNSAKSTLADIPSDFSFEAGNTYRVMFDAKNKKIAADKKEIGSSGDFTNCFEAVATFSSSNTVGLATLSDGTRSATVIIDNLLITDLKGSSYVNNTFDSGAKVGDGSMKTLCTNPETGEKLTGGVGSVYIHKDIMCVVRFVSESGNVIQEQNVCLYGSAAAPSAPAKTGYEFVGWSESLNGIKANTVIYPLYRKTDTQKPNDPPDITTPNENNTEQTGGDKKSGGCKSSAEASCGSLSLGVIICAAAIMVGRRKRNETL